ncbi:hypothetical protein [Mycobacterium simiae]|nr:hypothetical protein [Mycobacterium simiae]PLV54030.1 hypothetical protein X011_04850 [Mycobacterium tuberculosis variant microti OV254]
MSLADLVMKMLEFVRAGYPPGDRVQRRLEAIGWPSPEPSR